MTKTTDKFPDLEQGFSLIEMAMVLVIIGLLLGGVLVAVSQTIENARRATARAQLREVETALYGYAQAYGRLPCPATHNSNGLESPVTGGPCTNAHGFVPSVTLNLNGAVNGDVLLLDPWQNPLRYSVASTSSPSSPLFTNTGEIQAFFASGTPLAALNMLKVCSTSPCTAANEQATLLPAIVFSMGPDWSFYTSASEQENAGNGTSTLGIYNVDNDNNFVSAEYAEDIFDDQLVWLSPYVLFNKMISAGKLP